MNNIKILLFNPSQKKVYGKAFPASDPPLGLLYIGAALENKGHLCMLIDLDADNCFDDKLTAEITAYKPDVVGITSSTSIMYSALEIGKLCKELFPNVPVIMGGIHPTIRAEETLNHDFVDFVVVGEGEITIAELIDAIEKGEKNFAGIDGIGYKENGKVLLTKKRELIQDLDTILFPAKHLLRNPQKYVPPDATLPPTTSIVTSRGCFGKCTYCQTKNIFGTKTRFRSVKNVIDEIKFCIEKLGVREFHIIDDNFVLDKKRTIEICNEINNLGVKLAFSIFSGVRADCVDEEVLLALKSINLINIGFGVESGNQNILNRIKKGVSLDTYRKSFKLAKKIGFQIWGFFIIGLPDETPATARDTINFAKELDPDFAKFLILKPFPGSEVFDELSKAGLIFDHNYDFYGIYTRPVHRLPNMTEDEILYWQKKANREFYFRPKKILQHLLRIRSWTQLKFNIKSAMFIIYRSK